MTLDRVHIDGIKKHARRIGRTVDERDQQQLAERVWKDFLDPLVDGQTTVLEPIEKQQLKEAEITEAALQPSPYTQTHAIDSGTINPTSFKNGIIMDIAQAAMAGDPSDLDLHRQRSLIMTVHTDDPAVEDWETPLDDGNSYSRLLRAPHVQQFEENVVHDLSLHLAESKHALEHVNHVEELLVLDGPMYPKGILNWTDRPALADLLYDDESPRAIIQNYMQLVERFVTQELPLIGFVKNPSTRVLTRTLREQDGTPDPTWTNDTAFFSRLLEQVEYTQTQDTDGNPRLKRSRNTDVLTYTNWFRSRGGADGVLAAHSDALGFDRELSPRDYEVTFFVLYEPREDLLFRIEAPYGITSDSARREQITRWVLREVAAERGPPAVVEKADELARINREETEALRSEIEQALDTERYVNYDEQRRWVDR